MRSISVPPHRFTPLKNNWMKIYTPLVQHLKLQVRMNLHKRAVEIKVCIRERRAHVSVILRDPLVLFVCPDGPDERFLALLLCYTLSLPRRRLHSVLMVETSCFFISCLKGPRETGAFVPCSC